MSALPRKPPMGAPCNGCGTCCIAEPCSLALDYVAGAQERAPCPALEWEDGRAWCGMVRHPLAHSPTLQIMAQITGKTESELGAWVLYQLQGPTSHCDSGTDEGDDFTVGMDAPQFYHAWHVEGRR